jgi:phage gp46-like protein
MSDALIDPYTRTYILVDGAPLRDPAAGLANAVYLRLMTPLGSYWADPTLGSRLHELQREKDKARVAILAKQYAEQALAPLIADGRATAIEVSTEQPGNGRLHLLIVVTAASGEHLTFKHPVNVL